MEIAAADKERLNITDATISLYEDNNIPIYKENSNEANNANESMMGEGSGVQEQDTSNVLPEDITPIKEKKWSDAAIRFLIETYKTNKHMFVSEKKHVEVWNIISKHLVENGFNYDGKQCTWKFTRLKTDYYKKKDNKRATGEQAFNFKYFDEFDEIFVQDHNVTPIALASGRRKRPIPATAVSRQEAVDWQEYEHLFDDNSDGNKETAATEEETDNIYTSHRKAEKKVTPRSHSAKILAALQEERVERKEESEKKRELIERCHKENIDVYKDMMTKLIDKL